MQAASAALAHAGDLRARPIATEISFYFPVAVGGPITKIIDGYAADFQRENPAIKVTPIYAGTYQDTLTKAQTALKANAGPQLAVLLSTDVFSLIDDDLIVPFDTLADNEADRAWLRSFYPAFLKNGEIDGHTWGVPFQRSTIVLFWNKAAFQDAGLDPERAAGNLGRARGIRAEADQAERRRRRRWGVQIPASGFPYWLFQALATEAGATLANADGTETDFASPGCIEALRYWIDLTGKYQAHPPGIVDWATTPRDFLEQKVAMIWTTTGNLSNIRANAKFPFGVAMLPAGKQRGSPTGGGNFYLFRTATPAQREAALQFPALDHQPGTRGAVGHRHRLCRDAARRMGDAGDADIRRGVPGRGGGARPVAVCRGRVVDARQPARHPGAERRTSGRVAGTQAARRTR